MSRLLTFVLPFAFTIAHAQSLETLRELAARNQQCLDGGVRMLECSRNYCLEMDSILNLAYNSLRAALPLKQQEALKVEQRAWLKKRDKYYNDQLREYNRNIKSGEWGPDMFMVVYQDDAEFIRARNETLIKRLTHAGK